jgi:hypothetical protein
MADLVVVARFASRPEALIAQSALRWQGVEAFMPDFNVLMAEFDPSFMESGWRLMVAESDLTQAQAILRNAQQRTEED